MRVGNVFSGRPAYYDRNPLQVVKSYDQQSGPVSLTTQWTYTVPTGRKALAESLSAFVIRSIVATTAGQVIGRVAVTPSGGSLTSILDAWIISANALDSKDRATTGAGLFLAGDAVVGQIQDLSTGGGITYSVDGKFTEFDA